jgi:hypothetical protein
MSHPKSAQVSYAFMTSTVVPYRETVNALKVMTGMVELPLTDAYYAASLMARCMQ